MHSDLNTIKSPNIRDHLLRGDRRKLTQPVEEIEKNPEEDLRQHDLDNNQLCKQPLNGLEEGVIVNELENVNQTGWVSLSEDLGAITKTSTKMPGEDQSSGGCSTDENKTSHKSDQGTDVLVQGLNRDAGNASSSIPKAPIKVNKPEAYQGQGLPHERGQGTDAPDQRLNEEACPTAKTPLDANQQGNPEHGAGQVAQQTEQAQNKILFNNQPKTKGNPQANTNKSSKKIVLKQEIKSNNQNSLTPEWRAVFIKQLKEQGVDVEDSKVINFIDHQDPSKTLAGIEAVKNRGGGCHNRTAFFLREASKAKAEEFGSRGEVYGAEQRERDRKEKEELSKPENIEARSNQLFPKIFEAINQAKDKLSLAREKARPLTEADLEVMLIQQGFDPAIAHEEARRRMRE